MAWELANEPRCHSKDGGPARVPKEYEASPYCNAKKITAWVDAASAYIKSIDSNHLVALGDEGFGMNTPPEFKTGLSNGALWPFENKEGVDAEANLGLPNIDFGTFHLYPENWLATLPQEHETFSVNYINYHASLAKKLDKPVFLEEYGAKPEDPEKQKHYSYIQNAVAKNADIGGSMFW
ncbi:glycoside hydrolase superfamily [Paraphysoderma sedebokerense]|nr:glycoside hydrolase superfamily [Paraphysoderma sedebokerense]